MSIFKKKKKSFSLRKWRKADQLVMKIFVTSLFLIWCFCTASVLKWDLSLTHASCCHMDNCFLYCHILKQLLFEKKGFKYKNQPLNPCTDTSLCVITCSHGYCVLSGHWKCGNSRKSFSFSAAADPSGIHLLLLSDLCSFAVY